jgi:hypothetical protein
LGSIQAFYKIEHSGGGPALILRKANCEAAHGSWTMERFVHRQNIEHYREMLKTITDPVQREKIKKLLAEEEVALRKAEEEYKK